MCQIPYLVNRLHKPNYIDLQLGLKHTLGNLDAIDATSKHKNLNTEYQHLQINLAVIKRIVTFRKLQQTLQSISRIKY